MAKEPNWSSAELSVIQRGVLGLRDRRYPTARAATHVCVHELAYLRSQRRGQKRQLPERSRSAVYTQVCARAVAAGVSSHAPWWKPAESSVVARYGRGLARGRYAQLAVAARECREEWHRLARRRPGVFRDRTLLALRNAVRAVARELGWHTSSVYRDPRVDRILIRHARSLARGRYRSGYEAARRCSQDLAELYSRCPAVRRLSFLTVAGCIRQKCHDLGVPVSRRPWTKDEDKLARRYAREWVEGRYRSGTKAAEACARELGRLRSVHDRPRGVLDAQARIDAFAFRLGYPHPYADWTNPEKAILERHARGVLAGRHRSAAAAAAACHRELTEYYGQLREAGRLRSLAGRSAGTVLGRMHERVRELGRRGPPNHRWSDEEKKAAAGWLIWYDRHRAPGKRGLLGAAASGLQDELESKGFTRTAGACRGRLGNGWLQMHGLA